MIWPYHSYCPRYPWIYTDNNHNGRYDRGVDDLGGLDLVPNEAYRWQPPEPK